MKTLDKVKAICYDNTNHDSTVRSIDGGKYEMS